FGVSRRRRVRRQVHGDDDFVGSKREMRFAVFDIEFAERNAPALLRPGDFDLGSECQQSRCEIAGEGGMAALALRRHMADLAAVLEAVAVGLPPPLTLIVEDAARIEAQ